VRAARCITRRRRSKIVRSRAQLRGARDHFDFIAPRRPLSIRRTSSATCEAAIKPIRQRDTNARIGDV